MTRQAKRHIPEKITVGIVILEYTAVGKVVYRHPQKESEYRRNLKDGDKS